MNNNSNQAPTGQFREEKVWVAYAIIRLVYDLFFNVKSIIGKGLLPFRRRSVDIVVPGTFFFFVGFTFLVLFNFLPLFSEPTRAISITEMIRGRSAYYQNLTFNNVLGQYWVIIVLTVLGVAWISFLRHKNTGRSDESIYILGITAATFGVALLYVLLSFGIELFLVKLVQVYHWPAGVAEYRMSTFPISIQRVILFLIFLALPLLRIVILVAAELRVNGLSHF